jgi:hypothetical protein
MLAEQPSERGLVPAPKRIEERGFFRAHGEVMAEVLSTRRPSYRPTQRTPAAALGAVKV